MGPWLTLVSEWEPTQGMADSYIQVTSAFWMITVYGKLMKTSVMASRRNGIQIFKIQTSLLRETVYLP